MADDSIDNRAGTEANRTTVAIRAFTEERFDATCEAIDSALSQASPPDEVLVVIDHNPALLGRIAGRYGDREPGGVPVRVIANERTKGIGGGSNTALLRAEGDLVAFLDDDAVADPGWLKSMEAHFDDPDVVGVSGLTEADWLDGPRPTWIPTGFNWVYGCSDVEPPARTMDVRNVWGGNNLLRHRVVVERGGFLEEGLGRIGSHPIGCEDTELCIRIGQADPDARFVFEPGAVIHHKIPASRTSVGYFRSRCYHEGMSKALLSAKLGNQDGLAAERRHAFAVLPRAFLASLVEAVTRLRPAAAGRAAAIVLGLGTATIGMVNGRVRLAIGVASPLDEIDEPLA